MPDDQLATTEQPSIALMLQTALAHGITESNAAALDKMLDVYERMEARKAEQQFNEAFVALQNSMPEIVAQSVIPNRGKYERFEDLMHVLKPLLVKNGFSVSFSNDYRDGRVVETCHLSHSGGHSRANSFAVRIGKADTETQADCKAATTAKRNALMNALNIVIRQDCLADEADNSELEGVFITDKEAATLKDWVEATRTDEKKFLAFAAASKYEEIYSSRLDELHRVLREREEKNKAKAKGDLL